MAHFSFAAQGKPTFMGKSKIVIYSHRSASAALVAEIVGCDSAEVICCTSPDQIISTCIHKQPDLVIVLAVKPFINGSELIKRIRTNDKRNPPIYVIAWQQSEQIVLSLLECGVDQYMTFPICMSRLRGKSHTQLNIEPRI